MSAHTPGPWETEEVRDRRDLVYSRIKVAGRSLAFAGVYLERPGETRHRVTLTEDEALANARLIAAAPDGLAAAEEALRCLMDHGRGQADAIRLLRAFVAKAKGEKP